MANLTITSYVARNVIKFGGVGLVAFVILQAGAVAAIDAYKKAHPPYVAPTVKYGKLPAISFPEKVFSKKTFSLELPNDSYPKFSDQAKVYVIYRATNSLLALEEDTKTAASLGFAGQPVETKTGIYEWTNDVTSQKLTINVLNGNFKMTYPYENDQMLMNPEAMPTKDEAVNQAKAYLSQAGKLDSDLSDGEQKVSYWKITFNGLTAVSAISEATIIRVDFFRQNIETDYKIMTSDPAQASVSVLVSGATVEGKKIVEVNYVYIPIDRQSYSTYPIKTVTEAYNDLSIGNYWPANEVKDSAVTIRKIYLAYFEPIASTNFLQPIYVFEGDNDFVAYVPAVTDAMLSK